MNDQRIIAALEILVQIAERLAEQDAEPAEE